MVWNPKTGEPYGNAIVWQDTRTDKIAADLERDGHGELIRERSGLPPATYFAGGKLAWILDERRRRDARPPNPARRSSAPPTAGCCGT